MVKHRQTIRQKRAQKRKQASKQRTGIVPTLVNTTLPAIDYEADHKEFLSAQKHNWALAVEEAYGNRHLQMMIRRSIEAQPSSIAQRAEDESGNRFGIINNPKAYVRDPQAKYKVLGKTIIPQGVKVQVIENVDQGKVSFSKVIWDGDEYWTSRSNITDFDLKYATTYTEDTDADSEPDKELIGFKEKKLSYKEKAAESFLSTGELRQQESRLGMISRSDANKRDPETGGVLPETLEQGSYVLVLGKQTFLKGKKPLEVVRIMDLSGTESSTWLGNIKSVRSKKFSNKGELQGNVLDAAASEKFRSTFEALFGEKIEVLFKEKKFSADQKQLLDEAKSFLQDGAAQKDLSSLEIPAAALNEEDKNLNPDLINRTNSFYKFLVSKKLIAGILPGKGIFGVRANSKAHELSTRWMLNPQNTKTGLQQFKDKMNFVSRLIEINGKDPTAKIEWASSETVMRLKEIKSQLENPSLTDPAVENQGKKQEILKKELEHIVGLIQLQHGTQKAQAAEGYPVGDPNRRPNTNDTVGISLHCGGEAIDVFFNFYFNFYDPIIDAVALIFGLWRPVKDSSASPEYWHYERIGVPLSGRVAEQQE